MHPPITLRAVQLTDSTLLWRWRNDPETRRWFGDAKPITLLKHEYWFAQRFLDSAPWWIAYQEDTPVGVVRFEGGDGHYEVSVMVAPEWRKKGVAGAMLTKACLGSRAQLHATILVGNMASEALFHRCGFRQTATLWERNP